MGEEIACRRRGRLQSSLAEAGQTLGGRLERELSVPFKFPTMVAFGGSDLKTLFVTSRRWAIADKDTADDPLDGGIITVEAPVAGLPCSRWAG